MHEALEYKEFCPCAGADVDAGKYREHRNFFGDAFFIKGICQVDKTMTANVVIISTCHLHTISAVELHTSREISAAETHT